MDDATAERLLRGAVPDDRPELEPLATLLSQVAELGATAPTPTPALYALLSEGFVPQAAPATLLPAPTRSPLRRRLAGIAGLSLGMKVLAGTGVALAGVTTAAGAGVLPDAVEDRISSVVRTLTPFDLDPGPLTPVERPQPSATPAPEASGDQQPAVGTPTLPEVAPVSQPPRATPAQQPAAPAPAQPATPPAPAQQAPERPTPAPAPQERPTGTPPAPRETAPPAEPERSDAPATPRPEAPAAGSDATSVGAPSSGSDAAAAGPDAPAPTSAR